MHEVLDYGNDVGLMRAEIHSKVQPQYLELKGLVDEIGLTFNIVTNVHILRK